MDIDDIFGPVEIPITEEEYCEQHSNGKCEILKGSGIPTDPDDCSLSVIQFVNGAGVQIQEGYDLRVTYRRDNLEAPGLITGLDIYIPDNAIKLGSLFVTTPWGVIKKNRTGVGATTLELLAPRDSIIVVPTKSLAYTKYKSGLDAGKNYCYVGSPIGDITDVNSKERIRAYVADSSIQYKKFLVVADSFYYTLLPTLGSEAAHTYFLMLDEIDIYQSDSTFRKSLGLVLDEYWNFPHTHRSMVSATIREFSDPQIQAEPLINLVYEHEEVRNIQLIHTNNINQVTKEQIEHLHQTSLEHIVIAYNTITGILQIIELLGLDLQHECAILCSESSKLKAAVYYQELINQELPKRITFITSAYFAGVDIATPFHLISISDARRIYTMLSLDKFIQIAGRCRTQGLCSETIIYNSTSALSNGTPEATKQQLLEAGCAIAAYANQSDEIQRNYPSLITDPKSLKAIKESIVNNLKFTKEDQSIEIVRTNNENQCVMAYFNIDAIFEQLTLRTNLYASPSALKQALQGQGHTVGYTVAYQRPTETQIAGEETVADNLNSLEANINNELIAALHHLQEQGNISATDLRELERTYSLSKQKEFIRRFSSLYPYLPFEQLISRLPDIKNIREYRTFHNAVMFWALADTHVLKASICGKFPLNAIISHPTLMQEANSLLDHFFTKTYQSSRNCLYVLGGFVEIKRSDAKRKTYKVVNYNPKELTGEPLQRITLAHQVDIQRLFLIK